MAWTEGIEIDATEENPQSEMPQTMAMLQPVESGISIDWKIVVIGMILVFFYFWLKK